MATGTLPVAVPFRQRALDDAALPRIAQLGARALERHPARLLDLVVVVGGVSGHVDAEVEADRLEHAQAAAAVPVLDVAEALDHPRVDPRLLSHLAHGSRRFTLARDGAALGQRP